MFLKPKIRFGRRLRGCSISISLLAFVLLGTGFVSFAQDQQHGQTAGDRSAATKTH